jgi:glutaredoxin
LTGEERSPIGDRASTGPLVTLYGKPGCHLCEEAREVIVSVRLEREFDLVEVDVTLDPALHREYGERIPVVAVDGEDAFEYFVDRQGLKERLDRVTS